MMTIAASRALTSDDVCFVGIGAPSAACNVARLTHAPDITLIYESGTIGTAPDVLPLSIGDGELCETAVTTVSVPEMFRYWLQGGRITIGFLGAAPARQVRQHQHHGHRRLSQADDPPARRRRRAGDRDLLQQVYITMAQTKRGMVEKIDFFTSLGHGEGGDHRKRLGIDHRGADAADHRPRHLEAGPGDEGVHRGVAASRRDARKDAGDLRLDREIRRAAGGDAGALRDLELKTLRDLQAGAKGRRMRTAREEGGLTSLPKLSSATIIRTPIGRFGGVLSVGAPRRPRRHPPEGAGRAQRRGRLGGGRRRDLRLRQPGGRGQPQRGAHGAAAGRPAGKEVSGTTINRLCGSGMDAVIAAARAIKAGEAELMIAGGVESR